MTVKRGGLGKNLSALLGANSLNIVNNTPPAEALQMLRVDQLQPGKYQPRGDIEEALLQELAQSIRQQGLIQPIVVRTIGSNYEIIAGERRWRACMIAQLKEIPVIVRDIDDETAMAVALIENLQREDLNAMDQARAMHRLTDEFHLTHQQVADILCMSRTSVSNTLRLLNLHEEVCRLVEHGDIDMGHARALLILENEQQRETARLVVAKQLSVRETEKLVAKVKAGVKPKAALPALSEQIHHQVDHLAKSLSTKVQIKNNAKGNGSIVIHFKDETSLKHLLNQFDGLT